MPLAKLYKGQPKLLTDNAKKLGDLLVLERISFSLDA